MRIVIDTSVVVSAAIRDREPEELLLLIVDRPNWQWLVTNEMLAEYLEVLGRPKFALPEEVLTRWRNLFDSATTLVEVQIHIEFPRDPKDRPFLECAVAAGADILVTGDRDLLDLLHIGSARILSVRDALQDSGFLQGGMNPS